MTVLATAGHVDHGKSTLVQALTGTDPDRWDEEKRRGLTIDLGFATMDFPAGMVSFVDVPGHSRFLRNMLAGVGEVDGCLFVVSAAEGWKPQSEEHLSIIHLHGVPGVVALTMADLVSPEELAAVQADVRARLQRSCLANAEIVPVAASAGIGVDALVAALDRLVSTVPSPDDRGRPRLWIDRAFHIRGAGTVVTGTLAGGSLHDGDRVVVEPGGRAARVRSMQHHDQAVTEIGPGHRVALNLAGVELEDVGRGHAVVLPDRWQVTRMFDASLGVRAGLAHPVTGRGAHLLHLGTDSQQVRIQVLQGAAVEPGQTGLVRIHLLQPLPLVAGDRYILRDLGRNETLGGGEVLDVAPQLPASRARPSRSVERIVAEYGWIHHLHLERLTGLVVKPTVGPWVIAPEALAEATGALASRVTAAMPLGIELPRLNERDRELVRAGLVDQIEVAAGFARLRDAPDPLTSHPWRAALKAGRFTPPPPDGVTASELRALVRQGHVIESSGVHFHPDAIREAADLVRALLERHPGGVTISEVREAMGTTRKYALPLLNELDGLAVTRRAGDRRVAGPALAADEIVASPRP